MEDKFLKINEVLIIIQISRASLYRLCKEVKLLKPIKIGGSSFWSKNNIHNYLEDLKKQNL